MGRLARRWFAIVLWKRILAALALGAAAGFLLGERAAELRWIGDLFVRMIRMLIVPLVFTTLVAGIVAMSDPRRLGSIGTRAAILYFGTTIAAILIGIGAALLLKPGAGVELAGATPAPVGETMPIGQRMMNIVPENLFDALARSDVLAIIFFGVLLGSGMLMAGERAEPLARLFDAGAEAMLKVSAIVMEFAPFGVFALVAWVMGTEGPAAFLNLFLLTAALYGGGLAHMILVHGGTVRIAARLPALPFFRGIREPQLLAFSTCSSSATLPATLSTAERNLGIKSPVASSVLPLGATINMDGTALYVAIVVVFAAQAFGVHLTVLDYLMIVVTTTLVSIGTASVPSASLFLMAAVLDVVGIGAAQTALVIGFLLPFDRVLDMWRTVVNVSGDLAVATVVARQEGELDQDVYRRRAVE
ncbi:MAG: dicarboxylate/amino acid:cation symporter [Allosphingosinicella sp.]|uniref:dicarboxylate/amino acid:cation symporter n=1 Tax=Allosphingosinicella sp. TaxID=2823234 RepID=UPI00392586C3